MRGVWYYFYPFRGCKNIYASCVELLKNTTITMCLFIDMLFFPRPSFVFVGVRPRERASKAAEIAEAVLISLFAAEDEGRTFDPTERKIQKAREEGRVSKSQELPSALILLSIALLFLGFGGGFLETLMGMFRYYFQLLHRAPSIADFGELRPLAMIMFRTVAPAFGIACVVALFSHIIQTGWVVSAKPISPDFSRVGFKLSRWMEKIRSVQGWYTLGFTLIRLGLVSAVIVITIGMHFNDIAGAVEQSFFYAIAFAGKIAMLAIVESAVVLLLLSFIDAVFQRYLFREQLKMTRQEIKDEIKESEGDAEVRQRIQNKMREFINRNVKENVRTSDVLITNPSHFAVALKYDKATMDAPTVMAKGEDAIAFRMKRIAKEFLVPIIENKPLARALHSDLAVGEEIPERYYNAVVVVFEQVYRMRGMNVG